ncbi:hypothetical protein CsSME_00048812 [Camellia sinensis var. sinensis]
MTMQTRVFIVHMTRSLSVRLFTKANEIGMMSEGYVWIITDGITNSLNFFDPLIIIDSMQGVIGVKPHVPKSAKLEDFTSRWKNRSHQEKTSSDLNVFGLWAYDAATALAMAVEKLGTLNLSISNFAKNSTTDFESVGVSQNGIHLCQALSSTRRFRGLSGNFSFVDGQLQSSAFEIVNVIGNGPRGIGFWTPEHGIVREFKFDAVNTKYKDYSTSQAGLKAIIWPGDTTYTPKGWVVPTNGKVLRVAVPVKNFYSYFVRVTRDAITNKTSVTGYCIDIFDAVMAALPYSVPYEFIPFEKPYGERAGYDILVHQVFLGKFDAVVGDITIRANRSKYVDFTFPYTESGVTMIVPFKDNKNLKNAWVFLKPLTWDLWVTSTCFFVFIGFVIWILEHQINEDFNGPPLRQVSTSVWFSFSTMIFSHKEKVVSNLARFVVIIWCFVVLILTQSYTASLTALLTVHQLEPSITDVRELINKGESVGYPKVSFIYDILKRMNFSDSQLKGYNTVEGDLDVAFSNQSIVAAFDEIPYLKLFTGRHCSKYTMVAPTHKTGGFGFVYSLSLIHGFKFWQLPDTNWAIHIWLLISPYHYLSPVIHNQYS